MRYALRQLLKNPGFTAVAVLTLALGIGANTAIFSFYNAVILAALPYTDADRLVAVWARPPSGGLNGVSGPNYVDWQKQSRSFSHLAAYRAEGFSFARPEKVESVDGAQVSVDLFAMLGLQPMLGRTFRPEEGASGSMRVVVLSHRLWQESFGADTNVLGQTIQLNKEAHTVIGIMPSQFKFLGKQKLWTPLVFDPNARDRDYHQYLVFGRLRPGATLDSAQADMDTIASRLATEYAETNQGWGATVVPMRSFFVSETDRLAGWVLLGIVLAILLIACSNVANLFLARGTVRQHELAIRSALGASRGRLIRQLLCESLLLGVMGGAGGALLATWATAVIKTRLPALVFDFIPNLGEVSVDGRVLLYTLVVSLLAGMLFGIGPAIALSKPQLASALNSGTRTLASSFRRGRVRSLLVVSEFAMAVVLLTLAGLFIRSIWKWKATDPGYRTDRLLVADLITTSQSHKNSETLLSFFRTVCERTQSLPGIESVGLTSGLPEGWNIGMPFEIQGRPVTSKSERPVAGYRSIDAGYFQAMGFRLERGRGFAEADANNAKEVAIISQTMARRFWPNEDPIGQHILLEKISLTGSGLEQAVPREIVGVVNDVKYFSTDPNISTEIYVPLLQNPVRGMSLVVRAKVEPWSISKSLRDEIHAIDKDIPLLNLQAMTEIVTRQTGGYRVFAELNGLFASLALVLAALGIYGVMSYVVSQRTQEIGIRMALGATDSCVRRQIVREGLKLALIGLAVGLVGAFVVTRLASGLMINLSPSDPLTFVGASALLISVALCACYLPARRATRVDPMVALRNF